MRMVVSWKGESPVQGSYGALAGKSIVTGHILPLKAIMWLQMVKYG